MSLHDVDRSNSDRGAPIPNQSDVVIEGANMAHGTNSVNYRTDATPGPTGGTNTGTAGGGNTIAAGLKRLVLTCPVTVVNSSGNLTTATVAHNLGYVPMVEASIDNATITTASGSVTGASLPIPNFTSADLGTAGVIKIQTWVQAFADSTNLYVNLINQTGSPTSITITCYLYQRVAA